MKTILTFKKRVPQKRRRALLGGINPKFRPVLTPTALILRHPKHFSGCFWLYLAFHRYFTSIN